MHQAAEGQEVRQAACRAGRKLRDSVGQGGWRKAQRCMTLEVQMKCISFVDQPWRVTKARLWKPHLVWSPKMWICKYLLVKTVDQIWQWKICFIKRLFNDLGHSAHQYWNYCLLKPQTQIKHLLQMTNGPKNIYKHSGLRIKKNTFINLFSFILVSFANFEVQKAEKQTTAKWVILKKLWLKMFYSQLILFLIMIKIVFIVI